MLAVVTNKVDTPISQILTCVTSKVANNVSNYGDPRQDETRIKQMRPCYTSGVRHVAPPNLGKRGSECHPGRSHRFVRRATLAPRPLGRRQITTTITITITYCLLHIICSLLTVTITNTIITRDGGKERHTQSSLASHLTTACLESHARSTSSQTLCLLVSWRPSISQILCNTTSNHEHSVMTRSLD